MKKTLLASAAFIFVGVSVSFAAMPILDLEPVFSATTQNDFLVLAKKGSDDGGGDDNGGDDNGGDDNGGDDNGGDNNSGGGSDDSDDSNDDNGGDSSFNDDSNDDSPQTNSNRRKKRIPGGSGCDDPGDVAEHAACRAQ
jgi:hypothetical protein